MINMVVKPKNKIEEEIFDVWKELTPSSAFKSGLSDYAGKLFVPSEDNIRTLLKKITNLKKKVKDRTQQKFLQCLETAVKFEEPYMVLSDALWTFFAHLVKEGINVEHLLSLISYTTKALQASKEKLTKKKWAVEIKVITCNHSNSLLALLKTIYDETKDEQLRKEIGKLNKVIEDYRQAFFVEGVKEGDFEEVFPIFEKWGGDIGRKHVYPTILKDMYDYPETAEEIERKALRWLKEEMPRLKEITEKLAKKYGVDATVEAVTEALTQKRKVEKNKVVKFIVDMREKLRRIVETHLVRITPKYETRVAETPPYLVNMITTAAMTTFNSLTEKPFNVFFVTTDPKRSPPTGAPDIIQLLVHEEYGHCVNYSNSATGFGGNPTLIEMLDNSLHLPVSDGISFFREYEFLTLLKKLARKKDSTREERELLEALKTIGDLDTIILENEFIMMTWRIMRFLRAIGDVRINMGKQSVAEFVNWAHRETGLSKKMIYNQIIIFQDSVGYAPCYSMAGDQIRKIQSLAIKKGKSVIDFNTYACSMGFPPRTVFEERLKAYATSTA